MTLSVNQYNIKAQCTPISSGVPRLRQNDKTDSVSFGAKLHIPNESFFDSLMEILKNSFPDHFPKEFSSQTYLKEMKQALKKYTKMPFTIALDELQLIDSRLVANRAEIVVKGKTRIPIPTTPNGPSITIAGPSITSRDVIDQLAPHIEEYLHDSAKETPLLYAWRFFKHEVLGINGQ